MQDDEYSHYVVDCPIDMGYYQSRGSVRVLELNNWLGKMLADDYEIAWLPLNRNLKGFADLDEDKLLNWLVE